MEKSDIFRAVISGISKSSDYPVSLSDIANSIGCRKQSLYSYFKNKDDLISQSLEYAGKNIRISDFKVNFKERVFDIFRKLCLFYISIFREGMARDYLSIIMVLQEKRNRAHVGVDDIIYMFETQSFFILNELAERNRIKGGSHLEYLSHLVALSILEMICEYSDDERAEYDISKLAGFLERALSDL